MERLWAPWRLAYVGKSDAPADKDKGCFFCRAWADTGNEETHFLLARGKTAFALLNRYPYTNGHLMVAPVRHEGNMEQATPDEGAEIWRLAADAKMILAESMRPDGFNLGINQGRAGGAGVLDHLHLHVVPRWDGDTNFMPVLADVRVVPEALRAAWARMRPLFLARGYA